MAVLKNVSNGALFFGRFKLKAGDTVPAVEYTETEQNDIDRFVKKGILAEDGAVPAPVVEPVVEPVVAPEVVDEVAPETTTEAEVEDTTTKRGRKKA